MNDTDFRIERDGGSPTGDIPASQVKFLDTEDAQTKVTELEQEVDSLNREGGQAIITLENLVEAVGDTSELETESTEVVGAINEVKNSIPSPITVDDTVTKNSNNPVKSSGIYSEVHPANGSAIPTDGMLPNVLYNLGTISQATTMSLATPVDASVMNHYYFTFDIGATVPQITWDAAITSWKDGGAPILNENCHYEVSVLGGVAVIIEV